MSTFKILKLIQTFTWVHPTTEDDSYQTHVPCSYTAVKLVFLFFFYFKVILYSGSYNRRKMISKAAIHLISDSLSSRWNEVILPVHHISAVEHNRICESNRSQGEHLQTNLQLHDVYWMMKYSKTPFHEQPSYVMKRHKRAPGIKQKPQTKPLRNTDDI